MTDTTTPGTQGDAVRVAAQALLACPYPTDGTVLIGNWLIEHRKKFEALRAALAAPTAQAAQQDLRLNRIAQLIGAIYVYGDFKAETMHEQELEQLLRENGTFWETVADYEKWLLDENALAAPPPL